MVEINMRKKLPKRMMIASIGKEEKQRNHASWNIIKGAISGRKKPQRHGKRIYYIWQTFFTGVGEKLAANAYIGIIFFMSVHTIKLKQKNQFIKVVSRTISGITIQSLYL